MKLPDFTNDSGWNGLRSSMRAPFVRFNTNDWRVVNSDDLLGRLSSTGIEVTFDEISINDDGTFSFKGERVLVHIQDQRVNPRYANNGGYRFHLCNCGTIEDFRKRNQLERYVVSRRTDGLFIVNEYNPVTRQYISKGQKKRLTVCKNCLLQLNYRGYSDHKAGNGIYSQFNLEEFFEEYQKSPFHTRPQHYAGEAFHDQYSNDFSQISSAYRASVNWTCEECGRRLDKDKGALHVHHRNGIKSDNSWSNLQALCVGCHAEQPGHERMKFQRDYQEFRKKYGAHEKELRPF